MQLTRRDDLGLYLNDLALTGHAAEVGVAAGEFSARVLAGWRGRRLFLVDPWAELPREDYFDQFNHGGPGRYAADLERVRQLAARDPRAAIVRAASPAAADGFPDGSLDFVYLDANHRFEAIRADLDAWYPKVRPGGLFCGHDYLDGYVPGGPPKSPAFHRGTLFHIRTAVDQFGRRVGRRAAWTTLDGMHPTWYFRKPTNPPPPPERITVLSAFDRSQAGMGGAARANHAAYCRRHGYRYACRTDGFDPVRAASWSKLRFIGEELARADWVFWIDADALFMDWSAQLEWLADEFADVVLPHDRLNGINAGVFLVRSTEWAAEFLRRADGMEQFYAHPWWESAAFMHLERTDPEVRGRCALVPNRLFNSYPHHTLTYPDRDVYAPGDFVVHFAGLQGKEALVRDFAAVAEAANS